MLLSFGKFRCISAALDTFNESVKITNLSNTDPGLYSLSTTRMQELHNLGKYGLGLTGSDFESIENLVKNVF